MTAPNTGAGARLAYNPQSSPLTRAMTQTSRGQMNALGASPTNVTANYGYDQYNPTNNYYKQAVNATGAQANQAGANAQDTRSSLTALLSDPTQALTGMVNAALPQFNQELQGVRENAIRRGISTGDLGTSEEGTLASAFQRNIAGQAAGLYGTQVNALGNLYGEDTGAQQADMNRYTQMLSGQRDYVTQQDQLSAQKKSGLLGGVGGLLGSVLGAASGAGGFSKLFS